MSTENREAPKKLYRSRSDRFLGGVCGGIAAYFNVDSTIVRMLFVFALVFGGLGILLYIAALIIVPENESEEPGSARPSAMSGTLFWGILFVVVGGILLFNQLDVFDYFYYYDVPWSTIWAITLIVVGAFLLLNQSKGKIAGSSAGGDESLHLNITRSRADRKIAGICGGIAAHYNLDASLVRLGWILLTLASGGLGVVLYIVFMFILPEESSEQTA